MNPEFIFKTLFASYDDFSDSYFKKVFLKWNMYDRELPHELKRVSINWKNTPREKEKLKILRRNFSELSALELCMMNYITIISIFGIQYTFSYSGEFVITCEEWNQTLEELKKKGYYSYEC